MSAKIPALPSRSAATRVFQDTSLRIHGVQRNWDFAAGKQVLNRLITFLRKHSTDLGQYRFGFELTQKDDSGKAALTADDIIAANRKSPVIMRLGKNLGILATTPIGCNEGEQSEWDYSFASKKTVVVLYEDASSIVIYANGYTVDVINLRRPGSGAPRRRGNFSAKDYQLAIREHYREKIRANWQETDHWQDRAKRKLWAKLGNRKTEAIFHWSLYGWLDHMLDNSIVRSQPRDKSSDEPDIIIISLDPRVGGPFLAELKWLGWNGSTKHNRNWLHKGLKQLGKYLDKQPQIREATLVVYDGRSKEDFEALKDLEVPEEGCRLIGECDGAKLHARGSCIVFFLESETSSQQ